MLSESLRRIIADDPRRAMGESLTTIIARTNATTAGLFLAASAPELLASRLDQAGIDRVHAAWSDRADHFRDGRPFTARNYHVWSLEPISCGTPLIYVGANVPLRVPAVRQAIEDESEVIACAIQCHETDLGLTKAEAAALNRCLSSMPMEAAVKLLVKAHLERQEGNISKTASGLGISRTTLYQHMDRFNIPRPRGRGPAPPEPGDRA